MNQHEICQQLEGFHDRWLEREEREHFQLHLSTCPECREKLASLRETDRRLTMAWRQVVLPDSPVEPLPRPQRNRSSRFNLILKVAAVVLLAGSVMMAVLATRWGKEPVVQTPIAKKRFDPPQHSKSIDGDSEQDSELAIAKRPVGSVHAAEGMIAMPTARTKNMTVYSVIPNTTYFKPRQEND